MNIGAVPHVGLRPRSFARCASERKPLRSDPSSIRAGLSVRRGSLAPHRLAGHLAHSRVSRRPSPRQGRLVDRVLPRTGCMRETCDGDLRARRHSGRAEPSRWGLLHVVRARRAFVLIQRRHSSKLCQVARHGPGPWRMTFDGEMILNTCERRQCPCGW